MYIKFKEVQHIKIIYLFFFAFPLFAQESDTLPLTQKFAPPLDVRAFDTPNDAGKSITVQWNLSPDNSLFSGYEIYRSEAQDTGYQYVGYMGRGISTIRDNRGVKDNTPYYYKVRGRTSTYEYSEFSPPSSSTSSSPQWYHKGKTNVLIGLPLFIFLIFWAVFQAKMGKPLFIRKIDGLDSLEEAVGRATEMGKPVLYVPGTSFISDIATIASMNILSQVAKKTAEYNTPIIVPNRDPIVMSVAQEVVREAAIEKGRPDYYNPDRVFFLTSSQFAYAAGVCGIMTREKPATNLFIGMFWAESLLLAETGNITGAIQIAGTDAVTQLPFFVTACDYTIMGEELYAASAYLSKNPSLVGGIKGQDYNKLVIFIFLALGTIFGLLGNNFIINLFK